MYPRSLLSLLLLACSSAPSKGSSEADGADTAGEIEDTGASADPSADCVVVGDRPAGWGDLSHDNSAEPDYDTVFGLDRVHTLTLTLAATDHAAMYAELETLTGTAFGEMGGGPGGDGGGDGPPDEAEVEAARAACADKAAGEACETEMDGAVVSGTCTEMMGELLCLPEGGPGGGEGAATELLSGTPSYVEATVTMDGLTWCGVGMRYKGNATLSQGWSAGVGKLPFRLEMDQYEDSRPELLNQRFYGFKELTFGSGMGDDTLLREVLAAELLADRGVPVARSAFYQVRLDVGEGPVVMGLYTLTEDPSDAMMDRVYGDDSGNLYKPDGDCADLTCFDEASFEKKSNEDEGDWSDVIALQAALLADRSDAAAWRAGLEATLDVEAYLRWLAVNSAMENWDTYGYLGHNFYLYGRPDDNGRLAWVPWDHNLSLQEGLQGEGDVMLSDVGADWPLIRLLLDDAVYAARYKELLAEAVQGAFEAESFSPRVTELAALVSPYLFGDAGEVEGYTFLTSEADWERAQSNLLDHMADRRALVATAVGD